MVKGKPARVPRLQGEYRFQGNALKLLHFEAPHQIVVDDTKHPATIDVVCEHSGKRWVSRGIIKIEDGRLWMCFLSKTHDKQSAERPTSFESGEIVPSTLLVLIRNEDRREKGQ